MNPHYPDDCQNPDFDAMNSLANSGLQTATKPAHTSNASASTPTPWTIHVTGGETSGLIFGDGGCYQVADTGNAHFHNMIARPNGDTNVPLCRSMLAKCEANAALIVRAVNSHAELVTALETAIAQFDFTVAAMAKGQKVSMSSLQNCAANARAALAKAKA